MTRLPRDESGDMTQEPGSGHTPSDHRSERYVNQLTRAIHASVRVLALLMVFVIVAGVIDVGWTIWRRLQTEPVWILTLSDILATFGAFMAVLIAIEIFINITIYLREDVIHVKIVMATALMAIARKVIILDLETTEPADLTGIASIVIALSVGYWLVMRLPRFATHPASPSSGLNDEHR